MVDETEGLVYPEVDTIAFASQEDAQKMIVVLQEYDAMLKELRAENLSYQAALKQIKDFVKQA